MLAQVTHTGALLPIAAKNDDDACLRLVAWIKHNCDGLGQRLTVLPRRDVPLNNHLVVKRFASRGDVGITRSSPHSAGGPVLAVWPGLKDLGAAISATPIGQTLICLEWSDTESCAGWASAVGAYDAATDTIVPPLDPELVHEFKYLLMWDAEIGGGAKSGKGRERLHEPLAAMKNAGLNQQFVMTYAMGLGLSASAARDLGLHYREA